MVVINSYNPQKVEVSTGKAYWSLKLQSSWKLLDGTYDMLVFRYNNLIKVISADLNDFTIRPSNDVRAEISNFDECYYNISHDRLLCCNECKSKSYLYHHGKFTVSTGHHFRLNMMGEIWCLNNEKFQDRSVPIKRIKLPSRYQVIDWTVYRSHPVLICYDNLNNMKEVILLLNRHGDIINSVFTHAHIFNLFAFPDGFATLELYKKRALVNTYNYTLTKQEPVIYDGISHPCTPFVVGKAVYDRLAKMSKMVQTEW